MNKTAYICNTCGVEYEPSEHPPAHCPICEDARQYVPAGGQQWTTLDVINRAHKNIIEKISDNLYAIYTTPSFAIGQRAHLLITPGGNILWDCIANLDTTTVDLVQKLGGIQAIAISHPHYFATLTQWSRAFNQAPVYVHALDASWLERKPEALHLWEGDKLTLWDDVQFICCGGHFPGGNILYVPALKALLTGDVLHVCPDLKSVAFMYSYPNYIPLPEKAILNIKEVTDPLDYDAMFGAFGRYLFSGAKQAMHLSVNRYLSIFA